MNLTPIPVAAPLYQATLEPGVRPPDVEVETIEALERALADLEQVELVVNRVYALLIDLGDEDRPVIGWVCAGLTYSDADENRYYGEDYSEAYEAATSARVQLRGYLNQRLGKLRDGG